MTKVSNSDHFRPLDDAPVIDSFKIRIPLSKVEIIDHTINAHWSKVTDEGEVIGEGKDNNKVYQHNGIKTRFGIESQRAADGRVYDYLTILVNSKMLKGRYFEGITEDNVSLVYEYLMNLNCVSFTLATFLSGYCTDMDFKQDGFASEETYKRSKRQFSQSTKLTKYKGVGIQVYSKKDNDGVQWSDRYTTKYMSAPYLKYYHKETELMHHSKDFYSAYLQEGDVIGRVRMECTIKNKKHFRRLGIEDTTLSALLGLSADTRSFILRKAMSAYLEPRVHEIKNHAEMKPNQLLIYNAVMTLIGVGYKYENAKEQLLNNFNDKVAKSRKGAELDEMYRVWIKGADIEAEAETLNNLLDYFQCP